MDGGGILLTILLVLAGLGIYVLARWGLSEYECENKTYFMGSIPCYLVYLVAAVLIAFLAIWLYGKIMQRGHSTSYLITLYYIAIVVGIVIVSWYLFSHSPSKMQWVGLFLVVIGLILYAIFETEELLGDSTKSDSDKDSSTEEILSTMKEVFPNICNIDKSLFEKSD